MNVRTTSRATIACRVLAIACTAVAVTLAAASSAMAGDRPRPSVPPKLEAPQEAKVFLIGHAIGTQNYMCLPSGAAFAWALVGPQATLFTENGQQLTTHFLSVNPVETLPRATWQHSQDSSSVWAVATQMSSDAAWVTPGAIPWLLLEEVGTRGGPTGSDKLAQTTHIQRVNTVGGMSPASGCAALTDVGKRTFVPYEADYVFYKDRNGRDD